MHNILEQYFQKICLILNMSNHKIVYSTDNLSTEDNNVTHSIIKNNEEQNIRIHLDRKKGGKVVTVIKGFTTMNDQIKTLAKKKLKLNVPLVAPLKTMKLSYREIKGILLKYYLKRKVLNQNYQAVK